MERKSIAHGAELVAARRAIRYRRQADLYRAFLVLAAAILCARATSRLCEALLSGLPEIGREAAAQAVPGPGCGM